MFKNNSFYITSDGILLNYLGFSKNIIIPNKAKEIKSLEQNSFYSVTFSDGNEIVANRAFKDKKIKIVKFCNTMKIIGCYSFYGNELADVYLPDSVLEIQLCAFRDNKINNLRLSTNLKIIGEYAFYGNEITYLELPESLKEIRFGAFRNNFIKEVYFKGFPVCDGYVFANNPLEIFHFAKYNRDYIVNILTKYESVTEVIIDEFISLEEIDALKSSLGSRADNLTIKVIINLQEKVKDSEIKVLLIKLEELIKDFSYKVKYDLISKIEAKIKEYNLLINKEPTLNFNENQVELKMFMEEEYTGPKSILRHFLESFIYNLEHKDKFLSFQNNLKDYKELIDKDIDFPQDVVNERDKIEAIIYISKFCNRETLKESLKDLLTTSDIKINNIITNFEDINKLMLFDSIVLTFNKSVDNLYNKALNYFNETKEYYNFKNSLSLENDTNLSLLLKDIYGVFNMLDKTTKELLKEKLDTLIEYYQNKEDANINLLENGFRRDLQDILFLLNSLASDSASLKSIKEDLQKALYFLDNSGENAENTIILNTISDMFLEIEDVNTNARSNIIDILKESLTKWFNILDSDYSYLKTLDIERFKNLDKGTITIILILKDLEYIKYKIYEYKESYKLYKSLNEKGKTI